MAPEISNAMKDRSDDLRKVVVAAVSNGIPVPGFCSALAYFDGYCSARLPANLIQAQRDYFGAHTFERIDEPGAVHHIWPGEGSETVKKRKK
jgi:6-phosphogluconate dehydrogenase